MDVETAEATPCKSWEEEGVWDHFPGQKAGEAEPARRWWTTGGGGGNDGDDGGDPWERDWYWNNSWERDWGRWGSHTWASWNNWDDCEEDWHRSPRQSQEEPVEKEGAQGDVQKKEETPLEKGEDDLMKGTPSTPLEKGYLGMHQPMSLFPKPGEGLSMRQEVEEKNKRKKIMVDYHNTLAINDHITQESSDALESLLEKGHEVIICTWCGRDKGCQGDAPP